MFKNCKNHLLHFAILGTNSNVKPKTISEENFYYILLVALTVVYFSSCEDEKYLSSPDAKLNFSTDTVMFDTVFYKYWFPPPST